MRLKYKNFGLVCQEILVTWKYLVYWGEVLGWLEELSRVVNYGFFRQCSDFAGFLRIDYRVAQQRVGPSQTGRSI